MSNKSNFRILDDYDISKNNQIEIKNIIKKIENKIFNNELNNICVEGGRLLEIILLDYF